MPIVMPAFFQFDFRCGIAFHPGLLVAAQRNRRKLHSMRSTYGLKCRFDAHLILASSSKRLMRNWPRMNAEKLQKNAKKTAENEERMLGHMFAIGRGWLSVIQRVYASIVYHKVNRMVCSGQRDLFAKERSTRQTALLRDMQSCDRIA